MSTSSISPEDENRPNDDEDQLLKRSCISKSVLPSSKKCCKNLAIVYSLSSYLSFQEFLNNINTTEIAENEDEGLDKEKVYAILGVEPCGFTFDTLTHEALVEKLGAYRFGHVESKSNLPALSGCHLILAPPTVGVLPTVGVPLTVGHRYSVVGSLLPAHPSQLTTQIRIESKFGSSCTVCKVVG